MHARPIEQVLQDYTPELMSVPGGVGSAQGLGGDKPCIKVFVLTKTAELTRRIPGQLEGYSVVVQETGTIQALDDPRQS